MRRPNAPLAAVTAITMAPILREAPVVRRTTAHRVQNVPVTADRPSPMRTFDPVRLGHHEADAWVAYYRREWAKFLRSAFGMVRVGFGLSPLRTLKGAWYVLKANQLWAPFPDNDATGATSYMRRFYELVKRAHGETFDVPEAARLEIAWWRAHRELQHVDVYPTATEDALVGALADLYAHTYGVPAAAVRDAAAARAEAMGTSDKWVEDGRDPRSPALEAERAALVRGYTLLRATVGPANAI
jgi:hypothetical protein